MSFISRCLVVTLGSGLLNACAAQPVEEVARDDEPVAEVQTERQEVPRLTLHLPKQPQCACNNAVNGESERDMTFLNRGFKSLAEGDYIEAVQNFQRYQRLEKNESAEWESKVAIAYVSMLPDSPFFDPKEAARVYRNMEEKLAEKQLEVDDKSMIIFAALEAFVVLNRHVSDLENSNHTLKEDLDKREEALKRLRELTLGQRATRS